MDSPLPVPGTSRTLRSRARMMKSGTEHGSSSRRSTPSPATVSRSTSRSHTNNNSVTIPHSTAGTDSPLSELELSDDAVESRTSPLATESHRDNVSGKQSPKHSIKSEGDATTSNSVTSMNTDGSTEVSSLEQLSAYTCPICFYPPQNATVTPCGHICCGQCLFAAVKSGMSRGGVALGRFRDAENGPRCPVCRAPIPGWDGRGGGVIGMKLVTKTVFE